MQLLAPRPEAGPGTFLPLHHSANLASSLKTASRGTCLLLRQIALAKGDGQHALAWFMACCLANMNTDHDHFA